MDMICSTPLLSRLIDKEPSKDFDKPSFRFIEIEEYYEDIRQNLENILNSRIKHFTHPTHMQELNQSIINYGLPDFLTNSFGSRKAQEKLCSEIKIKIDFFEPRLNKLYVSISNDDLILERVLKIRIEAVIDVQKSSVPAVFESILDHIRHIFIFNKS